MDKTRENKLTNTATCIDLVFSNESCYSSNNEELKVYVTNESSDVSDHKFLRIVLKRRTTTDRLSSIITSLADFLDRS